MDKQAHIAFVASEGDRFATVAAQGDLTTPIPTCPGWDMRELVRHVGLIHLWAATHVSHPRALPDEVELDTLTEYWPDLAADYPSDDRLVDWYRATNANLVRVLTDAPADVDAFTFLPAPSPLQMWARRQASEIAMHRFDAEHARGMYSGFDRALAADALDEMLSGFAARRRPMAVDGDRVIHVHAEDTDEHWYVTIGPDRTTTSRTGDRADLTLAGSAEALYRVVWNRPDDSEVTMTGDTALMDLWHTSVRVRWS